MKKTNLIWGLLFIAAAVLLIANGMGLLAGIPWIEILLTVGLGVFILQQLSGRKFFFSMMALGIIGWIWDEELMIEEISPFPLLLAAGLVGIGLSLIFGRRNYNFTFVKDDGEKIVFDEPVTEWKDEEEKVTLENVFSSTSKYVTTADFRKADFENVFGTANVYFDDAHIAGGRADVEIRNVFGKMSLHFPKEWRLQMTKEAAFGNVHIYGRPSTDPNAPIVYLDTECVFGQVSIYFE